MSVADTRGVAALAALMAQLARGQPLRAAAFAEEHELARSSVFDIARRLQDAGFLTHDDAGSLVAGPTANALAWSAYGLATLSGPAEAVVLWLRDHTNGAVTLTTGEVVLLELAGPWPAQKSGVELTTSHAAILDETGSERARLTLTVKACLDDKARASATICLQRAAQTLQHHLRQKP